MNGLPIVQIGGKIVPMVKSLTVNFSQKAPEANASLALADPGAAGQGLSRSEAEQRRNALRNLLELDGRMQISCDGQILFTGTLEHVAYQLDGGGSKIALRARSTVKGLEEAAVPRTAFQADTPIDTALATLTAPFGVSVKLAEGVAAGLKIGAFLPRHGERLLPELLRLCRARGLTLRETPEGHIELGRPDYGGAVPMLRSGQEPLLDAAVEFDVTRRSDQVKAHGQRRQGAGHDPDTAARTAETLSDPGMTRSRTVEVLTAGLGDIDSTATVADSVRRARLRDSLRVRVKLAGWSLRPGGEIWRAGALLGLTAPQVDIDRTLVIEQVTLNWDTNGHTASLSLAPVEGYDLPPTGQAAWTLPAQAAAPASQGGTNAALVSAARAVERANSMVAGLRRLIR